MADHNAPPWILILVALIGAAGVVLAAVLSRSQRETIPTPTANTVTIAAPVSTPTLPQACVVPQVERLEQGSAEVALVQLGLQTVKSTQYSAEVAPGLVISQDPPAGQKLNPCKGDVVIVVSLGPTPTPAPSFTPSPISTPFSQTQTYDAAADFSAINNPNNVWSYGYTTILGGTFSLFSVKGSYSGMEAWLHSNTDYPTNYPMVWHNQTGRVVTANGLVIAPGTVGFAPGNDGKYSVIRWTAPATEDYGIHVVFTSIDVGGSTDVHILRDGVALFDGGTGEFGTLSSYADTVRLNQGQILDFALGYGGNRHNGDHVSLNVQITTQNAR